MPSIYALQMLRPRWGKLIYMTESVSESSTAILSGLVTKGPMKVLHVDDDSGFLRIAKKCLRMQGEFQVETVRCVEEAKDKLGREKYDVIVCDYQIPGKDGLEFLKELRKEGNNIPFIIFTGKGREEVAIKALNIGADGYFNKHGEPETVYGELAHGIRQALERKRAKMEKWQREEKLRATLDSSPDPIIISDLDGSIVDCNEATLMLTGYPSKKEIVGKNSFEFIAEKDRERALKNLKKASEQGAVKNVEYTFLKKGKEEYQGELSASALKDSSGNITGFVGIIRDITERKEKERRFQESEERYRLLFEQSPFGIGITHANGTVIDANSNMQTITGYSKEELKKINSFDMYEKPEQRKALLQAIKRRGGVVGFSARLKRKDGASVDALLNVSQVHIRGKNFLQTTLQDITEQKKAEEELRRFSAAMKESIDGIVISDLEGTVVDLNETALGFYGAIDKSEVIGKSAFDLMPPEQKAKLIENMKEVMTKGRGRRRVFDFTAKTGARISVDITTSLMRNADGSPAGLVAILRDITERKKAEEELESSRERLRMLFEYAPDAYYLNTLKGDFIDGNKAAEELTGYSKSELVGKSFLKLKILPRGQILKAAKLLALNAAGKPTGPDELVLNRKDGSQVPVEIRTYPVKIDGKTVVLGIARDITERKHAHELIQESRQKFEQLFMGNPEAAVYVDSNETVLDINQRFSDLFGYSPADIKGKFLDNFIVSENGRKEATMLSQKSGKGYLYHETVRRNKKGSLIPVAISAAPIVLHGQHLGDIVLYRDITERKKAEEEIREAMEKVEVINEKLRVVGGLTRHDVRNKLATVTGNAYLVRKKLPENSEVLDYVKQIEASVEQTVRIFDFAKAYEMLGVEELLYVDVEKTVNEAVSLFPDLRDVKVTNDCHGLTVLADSLLRQLFYNLIDNSLKHGEKLSIIRIHYEDKNDHLNMICQDDGVGISQAAKPKIFGEGYTTGKGSGYGLYLVKKMMKVYGWVIKETGEPGKGALFTMTIPKTNEKRRINYKLH